MTKEWNALARDVASIEALRAVKDLQRRYAHYAKSGAWDQMAALFAHDGAYIYRDERIGGATQIARWLKARAGNMDGLAPGSLHVEIIDQPLINLSPDALNARGRWMHMVFLGDGMGQARIEGGLSENVYVQQDGVWRIAVMHYHPQFEGDYVEGWRNVDGADLPVIPYHFTVEETGAPITPALDEAPPISCDPAELSARVQRLADEDAVRNLQNAYGYYVDRRMWTDIVDLFAEDCAADIDGTIYRGKVGIRDVMERMGSEELKDGQLNERPIFDLIVDILPGGTEAYAQGIELGLLSAAGQGRWSFSVFQTSFVREEGLWRLKGLTTRLLMDADYETGWGQGGNAPPALLDIRPTPLTEPPPPQEKPRPENVADLRRRLSRAQAYDGVENVSSAYGFYLDDFQWAYLAAIFAQNGNKQSPFAGYYIGRDRIRGAANASWGPAPIMRAAISFHWRTQPVIHVSQDGRSANLRTRLFQPRTARDPDATAGRFYMGGLHGGMYPNDQAVLEDGVWRLWSLTIDEHYFVSPSWKLGWAGVVASAAAPPSRPSPLLTKYPPDIPLTDLGQRAEGFRGGTGTEIQWPGILPMWFHYRNPVSGRVPDRYWPDCVPSEKVPKARMTEHGYQQPPSGPEIDGMDI